VHHSPLNGKHNSLQDSFLFSMREKVADEAGGERMLLRRGLESAGE
jgi:hypothetical protein